MKITILIVFFYLKYILICFLFFNSIKNNPYFLNLTILHKFQMWIWIKKLSKTNLFGFLAYSIFYITFSSLFNFNLIYENF